MTSGGNYVSPSDIENIIKASPFIKDALVVGDRRKFLSYLGYGCCGFILNSCATAPITERRQLKIIPEAKLNAQAAAIYELSLIHI